MCQVRYRRTCGIHCAPGGFSDIAAILNRKDGKHGIPDKAQHFALVLKHRARSRLEVLVQRAQKSLRCHRIREPGGFTHIAEPDHRTNGCTVSPFYPAIHHLPARAGTKVSGEYILSEFLLDIYLERNRDPLLDPL